MAESKVSFEIEKPDESLSQPQEVEQGVGEEANQQNVGPIKPQVKVDYYQTDSDVVVSVFLKNQEDVIVAFSKESLRIQAKLPDGSDYEREIHLAGKINPDVSHFKVLSTKIEIKMKKEVGTMWPALETEKSVKEFRPSYPSSSKKKVNWDQVNKDYKEEPNSDPNSLFSSLYESADDNSKKAMIKSMQESGGTVLNMNWEEVSKKRIEISPPDCMEFKKY